jgi:predicted ATPase
MLRRIYVDNYKCLVNFECRFDNINLIIGTNGSGKSSAFEVLRSLQDIVTGRSPVKRFQGSTLTRWQRRAVQVFELDIEGNGGLYTYRLEVEHEIGKDRRRVKLERVTFDGGLLYLAELDDRLNVHLYGDDHSEGPVFGGDWSQSGLAFLGELPENTKVTWLKRWFNEKLFCLQIDPLHIEAMGDVTETSLDTQARNFVGWYRHRLSSDMGLSTNLYNSLKDMYGDGDFQGLMLEPHGFMVHMVARLGVQEDANGKPVFDRYSFGELSDGERALIVLYTLLQLMSDSETTLCLDEPDNYLALAEIQPWLLNLQDAIDSSGSQAVLISHHPEIINLLAPCCGLVFERERNGPVRVKPFAAGTGEEPLTPSEVVARGLE